MKEPALLLLAASCAAPPEAARPAAQEFVEVTYPPPPAEVEETEEELPGRPECRWLGGYHRWEGRRWRWVPGEWLIVPAGCRRAPSTLFYSRGEESKLYYTPPRWYRAEASGAAGASSCPSPEPCQRRAARPR